MVTDNYELGLSMVFTFLFNILLSENKCSLTASSLLWNEHKNLNNWKNATEENKKAKII